MAEVDDWQPVGAGAAASPGTQPSGDDWAPVSGLMPTEPEPIPDAFRSRVAQGEALKQTFADTNGKSYSQRIKEWTAGELQQGNYGRVALGVAAATLAQVTEMARSGIAIAKDTLDGKVVTGPGLRKEDFSDDPDAPEPLDTLIQRSQDMAMMGGVRESPGASVVSRAPLIATSDGQFARPFTAPDGTTHAQVVGPVPQPADFKQAAAAVAPKPEQEPTVEANLRRTWQEDGVHPAEAAHDAQTDAFLRHDLSSAAVNPTDLPADVPPSVQPLTPPGKLTQSARTAVRNMLDFGDNLQMVTSPMAVGSEIVPKAVAKDFANALRRNAWDMNRWMADIDDRFKPEQQKRMWQALDEESVLRQEGQQSEHMGLATLDPDERAEVERVMAHNEADWAHMHDLDMVKGDPIPAYAARIATGIKSSDVQGAMPINSLGLNLKTSSGRLRSRKFLTVEETEAALKAKHPEASIARNIKANIVAMKQVRDAIAGREMVEQIKDYSRKVGTDAVAEGFSPSDDYFTIDHPSLKTWRPKLEKTEEGWKSLTDENGQTVFERVPIYIHRDWKGPLKAVLSQRHGSVANALMAAKSKAMSVIMYSPFIHNSVIYSKALAGFKGNVFKAFKMYFDGNKVKNDPAQMVEAINAGMVPIGKRFFEQDLTDQLTAPDLAPGRGLTAKMTGAVTGLFDPAADVATRRAIDKAGDFWHNTLLWDRVADLQAGIYAHFRDEFSSSGMDRQTAARMAAHEANRLAGSLPVESMSAGARGVANSLLFSRTFTLGNLGIMKDALGDLPAAAWNSIIPKLLGDDLRVRGRGGLPPDVLAQIERDQGPKVAMTAKAMARRQAISTVVTDMALFYAGTSIMQSAANVILGDSSLPDEAVNYWTRLKKELEAKASNPWSSAPPWGIYSFLQGLSATSANEPGKRDRVLIGYAKDGTAIYAKSPLGRIGEEFSDYSQGFWSDLLQRKLGTVVRPIWEIVANDRGFGRKVYDPHIESVSDALHAAWQMAKVLGQSQVPLTQAESAFDLVTGQGDKKLNMLATVGPFLPPPFTFTASKGAPGGPAVGELYDSRAQHDFRVQQALPGIRQMILRGDVSSASAEMTRLGVPPGLQRFYIRTTVNPATRLSGRTLQDFYHYATPEQRARFEALRSR